MRQHGRWGLISTNRVSGINCFIGVTVGTRTEGLLNACVLWCQRCLWFLLITTTVSGSNNDVDNIVAPWWCKTHACHCIRACFKYVSARLKPELQPAMGYTPLISSLCQLLLKPICHKERDKMKRKESRGWESEYAKRRGGSIDEEKGMWRQRLSWNCCFEEGQVLWVMLSVGEGGEEGWVATTLGIGS